MFPLSLLTSIVFTANKKILPQEPEQEPLQHKTTTNPHTFYHLRTAIRKNGNTNSPTIIRNLWLPERPLNNRRRNPFPSNLHQLHRRPNQTHHHTTHPHPRRPPKLPRRDPLQSDRELETQDESRAELEPGGSEAQGIPG